MVEVSSANRWGVSVRYYARSHNLYTNNAYYLYYLYRLWSLFCKRNHFGHCSHYVGFCRSVARRSHPVFHVVEPCWKNTAENSYTLPKQYSSLTYVLYVRDCQIQLLTRSKGAIHTLGELRKQTERRSEISQIWLETHDIPPLDILPLLNVVWRCQPHYTQQKYINCLQGVSLLPACEVPVLHHWLESPRSRNNSHVFAITIHDNVLPTSQMPPLQTGVRFWRHLDSETFDLPTHRILLRVIMSHTTMTTDLLCNHDK